MVDCMHENRLRRIQSYLQDVAKQQNDFDGHIININAIIEADFLPGDPIDEVDLDKMDNVLVTPRKG